jgi:hypothetical protein
MGLNSGTIFWMVVSDASYYINLHKNKVARWGTPKKKNEEEEEKKSSAFITTVDYVYSRTLKGH